MIREDSRSSGGASCVSCCVSGYVMGNVCPSVCCKVWSVPLSPSSSSNAPKESFEGARFHPTLSFFSNRFYGYLPQWLVSRISLCVVSSTLLH